jgi:hypothetical protein
VANQKAPFKQFHITRALRGAAAAGHPNPTVEFHTPEGGKIVVRAGDRPAATAVRKPVTPAVVRPKVRAPALALPRRPTR